MQNPEGAGRNILSVFCCNYYFIKMIAEPFLNTSRGVQDLVDNTTECMQMSRSRLSCGDLLSNANMVTTSASNLAALAQQDATTIDLENQDTKYDKSARGMKSIMQTLQSFIPSCFPSNGRNFQRVYSMLSYFAIVLSLGVVLLLVYAAYSVE